MDPLTALPPELVLKILDFTPISAVASLTAASRSWHTFIDETHQAAIYAVTSKVSRPRDAKDLSFLSDTKSFAKYLNDVPSWKDLCKRQTLLRRNWDEPRPMTRESVVQVGNDPVWRFRPDFRRRFIISTSQAGGLTVSDMDSGAQLWRLPSTLARDYDAVRPYAHLEYEDGMAVFDREGDAIEVWQTDLEGLSRGEFRQIAILPHTCQTRGFQLSYNTLCVVSTQGQGFVYDMTQKPPRLAKHLEIEQDAVGHLDQDREVVVYSMGSRGYHFHDKHSGDLLGALHPRHCKEEHRFHVKHPKVRTERLATGRHGPTAKIFPPQAPRKDRLGPIKLNDGPLPPPDDPDHVWHGEDEWGAGMLCGSLMVGFSKSGRVLVCSDWRQALKSNKLLDEVSNVIECESDGSSFDLGGWLSVRDHRIMFEIQDRIYIVALDENDRVQSSRASFTLLTSSAPQLAVPVSFMAMFDDCVMSTFTTLGWRQHTQQQDGPARIFPTKAVRIISLAPDLEAEQQSPVLWQPAVETSGEMNRSQTGLLQLVGMLGDEYNDEDDDLGVMAANFQDDE